MAYLVGLFPSFSHLRRPRQAAESLEHFSEASWDAGGTEITAVATPAPLSHFSSVLSYHSGEQCFSAVYFTPLSYVFIAFRCSSVRDKFHHCRNFKYHSSGESLFLAEGNLKGAVGALTPLPASPPLGLIWAPLLLKVDANTFIDTARVVDVLNEDFP